MSDAMRQRAWQVAAIVLAGVVAWQFVAAQGLRTEIASAASEADRLRQQNERVLAILRNRQQMVETGRWLHGFYQSDEGLKRPEGLWFGGQPDFEGIGAWLLDVYMSQRIEGATDEAARQRVVKDIQGTEEWIGKHPK